MRIRGHALVLALLLAPAAALAQQGAPAAAAPGTGPIDRLLQRKAELALTSEQVQKLEAIRQKSVARERELAGKVTEARGFAPGVPVRTQAATPAQRQALRDKGQPYLAELRQLHLKQQQEARGILNAEQNAKAWGPGGCCGTGPAMRRGAGRGAGAGPGAMRGPGRGAGAGAGAMRGPGMGRRGSW